MNSAPISLIKKKAFLSDFTKWVLGRWWHWKIRRAWLPGRGTTRKEMKPAIPICVLTQTWQKRTEAAERYAIQSYWSIVLVYCWTCVGQESTHIGWYSEVGAADALCLSGKVASLEALAWDGRGEKTSIPYYYVPHQFTCTRTYFKILFIN
jgi:hypothetical protein